MQSAHAADERESWAPCAPDELAMLPAPTGLLMKIMLFFPYPVDVPGLDVLPCMD